MKEAEIEMMNTLRAALMFNHYQRLPRHETVDLDSCIDCRLIESSGQVVRIALVRAAKKGKR